MSVSFRIPEIETERLRLRLPRLDDLDTYAAFRGSPRAKGVGGPFPRATSFQSLSAIIGQWQLRGYGRWLVADRTSDEPLGIVGVFHPEDWPEPEIAWSLFNKVEGRGIALEAALAARNYVYDVLRWDRIVSLIMPDNTRSVRLAERLGCEKTVPFSHADLGTLDIWLHPKREGAV